MVENNADKALLEEREMNLGGLTDSTRCFLIRHLANYVVSLYGLQTVTRAQLIEFSKLVLILFPSLSTKNGNDKDTVSWKKNDRYL